MTVTTPNASSSADPPSDDSRTAPAAGSTPQRQGSQSSTSGLANQFVGDTGNKGSENVAGQTGSQTSVAGSNSGQGAADPQRGHKQEEPVELDEFGLPVRKTHSRLVSQSSEESEVFHEAPEDISTVESEPAEEPVHQGGHAAGEQAQSGKQDSLPGKTEAGPTASESKVQAERITERSSDTAVSNNGKEHAASYQNQNTAGSGITAGSVSADSNAASKDKPLSLEQQFQSDAHNDTIKNKSSKDRARPSEWSHQRLTEQDESDEEEEESEGEWRDMPALGEFDVYDDYGRIIARGSKQEDDEAVYRGLGGAGKGYTRVRLDEDAMSATSMDEDTSYLFKEGHTNSAGVDEELRDSVTQLQATKDLLTESQRIAYVGVARLTIYQMVKELQDIEPTRSSKKSLQGAADSMRKWGQQMMSRLYTHMDIDSAEQIMIEQLAEHGVQPADLVRPLMQNARVKNPMAESVASPKRPSSSTASPSSKANPRSSLSAETEKSSEPSSPPPCEDLSNEDLPEVRMPSQLPSSEKIDIDLRWTVLCDLFLVLVSDATYDARSRRLLERVGQAMEVPWIQICRFEKRVTDALEMQETVEKEKWDETENMENRRKMALKKKYMIMGLATVGGGLVIGLSAGLLAPVIGAGLAAGFTTIGISGTSAFLSGAGGTALIAGGATLTGGTIGIRASHRRTGAVKTFEYRPLHNNKRVNLIITVSGWMTGKIDDVRLPYSTVDPIMGDIYSVLWEPEMLQSMGATINILATEALTQGLQQVLGSTVLVALMASLQLPIVLTKLSYLIDNPWNVSLGRANAAGLILADSLMARNLGNRPVTLLGFSLGSRVIFSCLKELANKGAYGLVQNVYLFGSPIVANKDEYLKARSVVSGRFVNGYASNDWILGYLFRATSGGIMRVAGLAPVEGIPGLENIDVTNFVNGHMAYRAAMPRLLREVGWEVLNEEFAEIEDPDPDNHAERQRELIREIDEARREAELKPEKKRFGFFKRGKLAEKKVWETYDPNDMGRRSSTDSSGTGHGSVGSVLFDIDAIRAELASEQIEVKQLESTLPPMKLDLNSLSTDHDSSTSKDTSSDPKQTKSADTEKTSKGQPSGTSEAKSPYDDLYTVPGEEDVQMTFDTSYQAPSSSHHGYSASSPTFRKADEDVYSSPSSSQLRRPSAAFSIGSASAAGGAAGVATSLSTLSLERNAWAEDEFGNGGKGEIQMTFE